MTLYAIDALVTKFRSIGVEAVITVFRVPDDVTVGTILVPDVPENEVTVIAAK